MAMSSAERQARFRERRKAQGLKRRDAWQDAAGFTPAETGETAARPRAGYNQYIRELKALVKPIPELEAEEIYAELLARARQLWEGWDKDRHRDQGHSRERKSAGEMVALPVT